jgi:hypothetical protein
MAKMACSRSGARSVRQDYKEFKASDVFEDAARMLHGASPITQSKSSLQKRQSAKRQIDYAQHKVRLARERAATAYLEICRCLAAATVRQNKSMPPIMPIARPTTMITYSATP